jgi:DNA-binding transcriptional LysR family regulator
MNRITIAQLEAFYWVAELGSVRQAANKLRLTQPTVSLRLRNLEAELAEPVLEPHGRGVRLTQHGHAMFAKAKSVLDAYAGFQADHADGEIAGTVRIGLAEGFAVACLSHLVPALAGHYPGLRPEWTVTTSAALEQDVVDGGLDLAVLVDPVGHRDLRLEPLGRQTNVWAGASSLGFSTEARPADFAGITLISTPPPTSMYRNTVSWFASGGLTLPPLCVCTSVNAAAQLVGAGIGVGIFPLRMVEAYGLGARIGIIPTMPNPAQGLVCFAHHVSADRQHMGAVMAVVQATVAELHYFDPSPRSA